MAWPTLCEQNPRSASGWRLVDFTSTAYYSSVKTVRGYRSVWSCVAVVGWKVAGLIASAAQLRLVDEDEFGWSLAMLSDRRGQAAVLRAFDALVDQRRK